MLLKCETLTILFVTNIFHTTCQIIAGVWNSLAKGIKCTPGAQGSIACAPGFWTHCSEIVLLLQTHCLKVQLSGLPERGAGFCTACCIARLIFSINPCN